MQAKYSIGSVISTKDGKVHTVKTFVKDFSNRRINYRTEKGLLIAETDVVGVHTPANTQEDKSANNKVKAKAKAEAVSSAEAEANLSHTNSKKIAAINALSQEQLITLIAERGLEIDPEDYATREELASAICEELDLV